MRKQRFPKVKEFVKEKLSEGIFSPSEMARLYNEKYGLIGKKSNKGKPMEKTPEAFTMAMRRMKISADKRLELKHENGKATETKDIEEYDEVRRYLSACDFQQITMMQRKATLTNLRKLWEMMNRTNPTTWTFEDLVTCLKENIGQNEKGQWKQKGNVIVLLGSFNRCFNGILPKGWSMGLKSKGEHKDFWEYDEFQEFINRVQDTPQLSKEGWLCLWTQQIDRGCREGSDLTGGILGAKWEQINYETKRTEQIDKGEKGHSNRLWIQVPCDLFPFLNGWQILLDYHKQIFGYYPSNAKHGIGRMFPISYTVYLREFHATRKRCDNRLSNDSKKRRPHVLRMTHAQYCKRIGISLENLCGDCSQTPSIGRYGVGWTDPKIPLQYYLTKESYEYAEQDEIVNKRLEMLKSQLLSFNSPLSEVPLEVKS